jgi:predicted 3-demethylubiquinone-9 3-methyltransferase (glyoxalase superfamily)
MPTLTTFLTYDNRADEAARFYPGLRRAADGG